MSFQHHHLNREALLDSMTRLLDAVTEVVKHLPSAHQAIMKAAGSQPIYSYHAEQEVTPGIRRTVTYKFRLLEDGTLELVSQDIKDKEE